VRAPPKRLGRQPVYQQYKRGISVNHALTAIPKTVVRAQTGTHAELAPR
jgi:hypothetical protein